MPDSQNGQVKVAQLMLIVVAMFGFGYSLVPLYGVICDITGLNGQNSGIQLQASVEEQPDPNRKVKVQFLTTVNNGLDWQFGSEVREIEVHPGQLYNVNFFAANETAKNVTAQATPSVVPWQAAKYVRKTECFCFSQQEIAAGERKDMPMRFLLDPALPPEIDTVTLSYTIFDASGLAMAGSELE